MGIRNLDRIFHPRRVAVIGASEKPASVGAMVMRNLLDAKFAGSLFPIHPTYQTVCGLTACAKIGEVPEPVDLAIVCTPAATVPDVVRQCGEAGVGGLVILSAGFREAGAEGARLEEAVRHSAAAFEGLRIIGPNCLGLIAPHARVNASFAQGLPRAGEVAFVSQSGALCTSVLDWAIHEDLGFSYFVSIGNALDVSIADLIDYFAWDGQTKAIVLYIESLRDARAFMSAARAFTLNKPIVAYKAGRFAESAQAAASHTGAMAGVDAVYDAALARAGIVRVHDMEEMFDCAELLARHPTPPGPRLAIVTNAGGPGVMAADALIELRGELARLSEESRQALDRRLPAFWSHNNPVDILGDATPDRYAAALEVVLADPGVDAALVILTPQTMTEPTAAARTVEGVVNGSRKIVVAAWMGADQVAAGIGVLNRAGIPTYFTPEQGVQAFMRLVSYARRRELLYETPSLTSIPFALDAPQRRRALEAVLREANQVAGEAETKRLLADYGIPVTEPRCARSAEEAVRAARDMGYPVVLKVHSPDITHKTDVGGVALNIGTDQQVESTFERIVASARQSRPEARIEGVTVQPMISAAHGCELIVGAKRDPVFGSVLLVGAGGIQAEYLHDQALELPPLNERLACHMLQSLRCWPLLQGARGRPRMNVNLLTEMLIRFSSLIVECPEVREIEINPLLVTLENVIGLDARMTYDPEIVIDPRRPFPHLAIRPYPQEFERAAALSDGSSIRLRPIRPEDEPLWRELVRTCSAETLRMRFRGMIKDVPHAMAARFCFIDYDRELAIVAERDENGQRSLLGVGRLVADADHRDAEFAVLVGDVWQGLRLGSLLTDECLRICRAWGIDHVWAETTTDNCRMLRIFERRGFTRCQESGGEVRLRKKL